MRWNYFTALKFYEKHIALNRSFIAYDREEIALPPNT